MLAELTTMPTTLPVDWQTVRQGLSDPLVRKIVCAAIVFIIGVIVIRFLARRSESSRAARARAELRAGMRQVRLQQEQITRLAARIIATSSTSRIAGFGIVRQIEAVFSDGEKSSEAAVELVKAHAAEKGANAIVNLQTRQTPTGKWVANGDAVVVKEYGQPKEKNS